MPAPDKPAPGKPQAPGKADLLDLPAFDGLPLACVHLPHTSDGLAQAWADLSAQRFIGFDTESKPTFNKGEVSGGPDVVQFASPHAAYVLQLRHPAVQDFARLVLAAPGLVKVGFGLGQDQQQLLHRLGVRAQPLLDLDGVFRRQGHAHTIGIKTAVALVFGRRFAKSKRTTTSNWSAAVLDERQRLYAANDAWVALRVLQGLGLAEADLPVWPEGVPPPTAPRRPRPEAAPAAGQEGAVSAPPRRRRRRPPRPTPAGGDR